MDTKQLIAELDAISARVALLKQSLLGQTDPSVESAESKVARGVCTYCGKPVDGKPTQRGAHSNCYRTAKRRIEQNKTTDDALVRGGWLLPPGTPGPKVPIDDPVERQRLQKLAVTDASSVLAEAIVDEIVQDQPTGKKKPSKRKKRE